MKTKNGKRTGIFLDNPCYYTCRTCSDMGCALCIPMPVFSDENIHTTTAQICACGYNHSDIAKQFLLAVEKMDGQILKTGEKKDEGKARMELLPFDVLEAVARILTIGATKYDSRNWEHGIEYGRIYGAALRHLVAFWNAHLLGTQGINTADGNESHLNHAITELMFLSAYEKRGMTKFDDRPRKTV